MTFFCRPTTNSMWLVCAKPDSQRPIDCGAPTKLASQTSRAKSVQADTSGPAPQLDLSHPSDRCIARILVGGGGAGGVDARSQGQEDCCRGTWP